MMPISSNLRCKFVTRVGLLFQQGTQLVRFVGSDNPETQIPSNTPWRSLEANRLKHFGLDSEVEEGSPTTAVVGLPSSTSLSNAMGTGRGIFGIWWSERRKLNWNTENESVEPRGVYRHRTYEGNNFCRRVKGNKSGISVCKTKGPRPAASLITLASNVISSPSDWGGSGHIAILETAGPSGVRVKIN